MPDTPRTATGRKVVAMHGSVLLDDVLGIEQEVAAHIDALTVHEHTLECPECLRLAQTAVRLNEQGRE
jgi:hypothetical protein